jgi:hypothetical protein
MSIAPHPRRRDGRSRLVKYRRCPFCWRTIGLRTGRFLPHVFELGDARPLQCPSARMTPQEALSAFRGMIERDIIAAAKAGT